MNKTIQDLILEVETIKKSKGETTLELENLEKRSGAINRIQEIEERLPGAEDIIENNETIKEKAKGKNALS